MKGLPSIGTARPADRRPVLAIAIDLEQEFCDRGGDLIGGVVAGFERPQCIGGAVCPAGLPLPFTIAIDGSLKVGQRHRDRPLEGILIDREAAGANDLQGHDRDPLIVAREAIALLLVDDEALLHGRKSPRHGGPDLGGRDRDGRHDSTRAAAGRDGLCQRRASGRGRGRVRGARAG